MRADTSDELAQLKEEFAAAFVGGSSPGTASPTEQDQRKGTAMIKLNCGVSRKVGEPNYGSRGASINVELELESAAAQDTQLLQGKIRGLFAIAKAAVDEELKRSPASDGQSPEESPASRTNGDSRPASEAQLRAIKAICGRLGLDVDAQTRQQCGCGLAELLLPKASQLIDHLKGLAGNGQ